MANIRVRRETVCAYTRDRVFENVLDIGCGDGSLSLPFLSRNCKVTFLDLSNAMLEIVAKKVPDSMRHQVTFCKGGFTELDLPSGVFDLVIFVGMLAYVSDVQTVAEHIRRLVRPGGQIVVECTDADHILTRLNLGYRNLTALIRPSRCHTHRYSAAEVVRIFEGSGFQLKRSFRYAYWIPIITRFISSSRSYTLMRRLYGTAETSCLQNFGSELLMSFEVL